MNLRFKNNLHVFTYTLLFVFLSIISITNINAAGVPSILGYQGKLTDSGGNPLGGGGTTYYFKFSLWDNATPGSGNKLWPASLPSSTQLTVKQGSFSVNIGDTDSGYPDVLNYDFNTNSKIYLQVEVSGDGISYETLAPRSLISSNAFSQVANAVNGTADSSFGTTTPFINTLISALSTSVNKAVMTIKGMVGQVANLFNILDSSGNTLFTVTPSGNVSIGTTTPNTKFGLYGTAAASGQQFITSDSKGYAIAFGSSLPSWVDTTSPNSRIDSAGNFVFNSGLGGDNYFNYDNRATRANYFDGTNHFNFWNTTKNSIFYGNVGVGTTTPNAKLAIETGAASTKGLTIKSFTSQTADLLEFRDNANTLMSSIGALGTIGIGTVPSNLYQLDVSNATRSGFRFTSGTRSLAFSTFAADTNYLSASGAPFRISTTDANPIEFWTTNTRRGGIGAAGNINFGTPNSLNATYQLSIQPTVSTNTGLVVRGFTSQTANLQEWQNDSGTVLGAVTAAGNFGIGTTTPAARLDVYGNQNISNNGKLTFTDGTYNPYIQNFTGGLGIGMDSGYATAQFRLLPFGNDIYLQNTVAAGLIKFTGPAGTDNTGGIDFQSTGDITFGGTGATRTIIKATTGNVGIGTTTPGVKLDVLGTGQVLRLGDTSSVSSIYSLIQNSGGKLFSGVESSAGGAFFTGGLPYASVLGTNNTTALQFATQNSVKLTINSSGNIGIGTSTPSALLDVNGSVIFRNGSGTTGLSWNPSSYGNAGLLQAPYFWTNNISTPSGALTISPTTNTVFSTGNVGIGTTTPSAKLDVWGNLNVATGTTPALFVNTLNGRVGINHAAPYAPLHVYSTEEKSALIHRATTATGQSVGINLSVLQGVSDAYQKAGIFLQRDDSLMGGWGGGKLIFAVNGTADSSNVTVADAKMTLLPNGNVGIGTTNPTSVFGRNIQVTGGGSAAMTLDNGSKKYSFGVTGVNALGFFDETSYAYRLLIDSTGKVGIGTTTPTAQLSTTGTVRFSNFTAGTLTTDAGGNLTVSSDERLKDIQGDFTRGLEDIIKINPINYKWNTDSGYDMNSSYTGFSAQNIQLAIPEAVSTSSAGFLSLSDRPIIATLVNAVKELAKKVDIILAWFKDNKFNVQGDICVDDVCITKEQFKNILRNENTHYNIPTNTLINPDPGINSSTTASTTVPVDDEPTASSTESVTETVITPQIISESTTPVE